MRFWETPKLSESGDFERSSDEKKILGDSQTQYKKHQGKHAYFSHNKYSVVEISNKEEVDKNISQSKCIMGDSSSNIHPGNWSRQQQ